MHNRGQAGHGGRPARFDTVFAFALLSKKMQIRRHHGHHHHHGKPMPADCHGLS
jgi:hypothetical protein